MNDLIIKKTSDDVYIFSLNLGSIRWHFSILNKESASITGAWVRVGGCGSCAIQIEDQNSLWTTVLDRLVGEYERDSKRCGRSKK